MTPQALVFAAGLGTRLAPLTKQLPKALAPIHGIPALEWILRKLEQQQVQQIVINTHAHAEKIHRFIETRTPSSLNLQISHELILLDTGGGVRRSRSFWSTNMPILLHNADVFSNADLTPAWQVHSGTNPLATLLVQERPTNNHLLVDEAGLLCGVHYVKQQDHRILRDPVGSLREVGFCGIHLVAPRIFEVLPEQEVFRIIPVYLEQVTRGEEIRIIDISSAYWRDIGTLSSLQQLESDWLAVPRLADAHRGCSPHSTKA